MIFLKANIIDIFNDEIAMHNRYPNDRKYDIKEVFELYWDDFLQANKNITIRESVYWNINNMLKCRTPKLGRFVLSCPDCGNVEFHCFTCKSRMCPTCGAKYSNARILKAQSIMIHTKHRLITFTIAEELRIFFGIDRNMLNLLFDAISITLSSWAKNLNKKKNIN